MTKNHELDQATNPSPPLIQNVPFTRADDYWDLSFRDTATTVSLSINFSKYPQSFRDDLKDFVQWLWLGLDYSNSTINNTLITVNRFFDYLNQTCPTVQNLKQLDRSVALGFERLNSLIVDTPPLIR